MLPKLAKDYTDDSEVVNINLKKDAFPPMAAIEPLLHHYSFDSGRGGDFMEDGMVNKIIRHIKGFTSFYNELLQGDGLSLEALGLLVKMVSRPPDWDFKKQTFHTDKNGKFQINRIFKELQQFGHARIVNIYNGNRIKNRKWDIYENPADNEEFVANKGSHLKTGLSTLRKPLIKTKQPLQRKNINNTNNITTTNGLPDHEILKVEKKKAGQVGLQLKQFEEFWSHRPGRGKGSNSKALGLKQWDRRLKEGVDPLKLINALKFYKMCCQQDGIINTRTTMQVSTFLGEGEHYETDWEWKATIEVGKKVKTPEDLEAEKDRAEEMERQSEAAYLEKMKDYKS